MLGLSAAQIRSYASKGFLTPERGPRGEWRFGFRDLVVLRTAGELSSAKIPPRKVKRALLEADKAVPYGRVVAVLDVMNRAGVEQLGMITQAKEMNARPRR